MDIKKRINARKIVLSYFYQHCFFSFLDKKWIVEEKTPESLASSLEGGEEELLIEKTEKSDFLDKDFLEAVAKKKEKEEERDDVVLAKIKQYANDYAIEEEFWYILAHFFDQRTAEEVDMDYVFKVGNGLLRYENEVIQKVNHYAESFWYEKMDIMNQVLFLLGYCEYKTMETPKEVILNEMVELSKRYSDEGSPKLINGLLHAILMEEDTK